MRAIVPCLLLCLCAACGTSLNFISTGRSPRPLQPRDADRIRVYMSGRPARPYTELGIIEAQQEKWSHDDPETVVRKMRQYAGELGCDGLIIFAGNDATDVSGGAQLTTSRTLKGYRGSCIVYTGPAAQSAAAAAPRCIPNSTQLCYAAGGCQGSQRCTADGRAYTLCDCGTPAAQSVQAER